MGNEHKRIDKILSVKESEIKLKIRKQLLASGGFFYVNAQNMYSMSGISDLTGVCRSMFFALEIKIGEEKFPYVNLHRSKVTFHQLDFLNEVALNGGIAFILIYIPETDKVACFPIHKDTQLDRLDKFHRPELYFISLKELTAEKLLSIYSHGIIERL